MTELQMGMIGLGALAVIGVMAYNKWQEIRQRKQAEQIRSGFYHIAKAAHLPIVMFSFDYDIKTIHILGVYHLTGDYEYDLEQIYKHYEGKFSAKNPDWVAKPLQKLLKKD